MVRTGDWGDFIILYRKDFFSNVDPGFLIRLFRNIIEIVHDVEVVHDITCDGAPDTRVVHDKMCDDPYE